MPDSVLLVSVEPMLTLDDTHVHRYLFLANICLSIVKLLALHVMRKKAQWRKLNGTNTVDSTQ